MRRLTARIGTMLLLALTTVWASAAPAATKPPRDDLTIDPKAITQPWTGDLDQMVERRIVRVLVLPNKTNYFNDKGRQRGVTYDTFQLIEKELQKELDRAKKSQRKHLKVKFFFVPVSRDEIFSALTAGRGDIAAGNLSITPDREEIVDFAAPVITGVQQVVLTGPASPQVATLDDLAGKEVFVRKASARYERLVELNERFAAENKPLIKLKEAPDELADEDLIEMLNAGLVRILVIDRHIADFWKQVYPKIVVHHEVAVHQGGNIAWAVRKDSPQLKSFLDRAAATMMSGHLQDERAVILARYLKRASRLKDAASDAERRKFLALVEFFRKYGDRYDIDWMLMAAQGYQESQLNQDARSPVGAIGVMQVMPATGKDLNVGDIAQTEANVNAGVKYMRWMIDQFFEREPMTKLDKVLFAFAAYNCGPGRVAQLRKEAARRGLDPNVWFNNVEYIAAEKIGAETVTYVGNIFKYYIAYRLMEDELQDRQESKEQLKGNGK